MKNTFIKFAMASALVSSVSFANKDTTATKDAHKVEEASHAKAGAKHETAAEVAEKTRVAIRNAGIKVGHAVDEALKKPAKDEKNAKKDAHQ